MVDCFPSELQELDERFEDTLAQKKKLQINLITFQIKHLDKSRNKNISMASLDKDTCGCHKEKGH